MYFWELCQSFDFTLTWYNLFEECWGGPDESMGYENSVILLLCITAEHQKQNRA